jgi:transcriptional regulator with XRE-family HTH domain
MTTNGNNSSGNLVTPEQCRAGRGLLGWSQSQLAEAANVSKSTIANFEAGRPLATNNHIAVDAALNRAGVELIDPNGGGLGVRFRERDRRDDSSAVQPGK